MLRLPSLGELDRTVAGRIYLCTAATDMRKGFDALAALVCESISWPTHPALPHLCRPHAALHAPRPEHRRDVPLRRQIRRSATSKRPEGGPQPSKPVKEKQIGGLSNGKRRGIAGSEAYATAKPFGLFVPRMRAPGQLSCQRLQVFDQVRLIHDLDSQQRLHNIFKANDALVCAELVNHQKQMLAAFNETPEHHR